MRSASLRPTRGDVRLRDLAAGQCRLVEMMRVVRFGDILDLHVVDGSPIFDPPPRVLRKLLIGGDNGAPDAAATKDFVLRRPVLELLQHLVDLGTGTADIAVQGGLPVRLTVESRSCGNSRGGNAR